MGMEMPGFVASGAIAHYYYYYGHSTVEWDRLVVVLCWSLLVGAWVVVLLGTLAGRGGRSVLGKMAGNRAQLLFVVRRSVVAVAVVCSPLFFSSSSSYK